MNRHFINSFTEISFGQLCDIHKKITNSQFIKKNVTEQEKDYIRKYMLKCEYIESVKENEIVVSTNNSTYTIKFFEGLILLIESINNKTMLGRKSIRHFKKAI